MIKTFFFLKITVIIFLTSCSSLNLKLSNLHELPKEIDTDNLPVAEQFPDSDGVILYENIVYDVDYLRNIGIETYRTVHRVIRVFGNSENFMKNYLSVDQRTVFDSFSARNIKPDGTIINIHKDDLYIGQMTAKHKKFKGTGYGIHFNYPKLENGDIIEIKYTTVSRYFYLADSYFVQGTLPKIYTRFEIRIPNFVFSREWAFDFSYIAKNIEIKEPSIRKGFGNYGDWVYVWENRNIPAYIREPLEGPSYQHQGHIDLRLAQWKTWNGLARDHYERNYKPVLDQMNKKEKEQIKEITNELASGIENEMDKIRAVMNFMQKFKYSDSHVFFGHAVKPNNISTILSREYGDCKDQTVILTALLREIGINAWPALIRAGDSGRASPEFVTDIFNHVIVKVTLEGGQTLWLDPVSKTTPFGKLPKMDEDTFVLEMRDKNTDTEQTIKLHRTPVSNYSDNLYDKNVIGHITDDMVRYRVRMKYTGNIASSERYRFENMKPINYERRIRNLLRYQYYNAEIENIDLQNLYDLDLPLFFSFDIILSIKEIERIPLVAYQLFKEPVNPNLIYLKNRTRPVVFNENYSTREYYELSYDPEKYGARFFNIEKDFSAGNQRDWKIETKSSEGKISVTTASSLKERIIPIEDLSSFLENTAEYMKLQHAVYWIHVADRSLHNEENLLIDDVIIPQENDLNEEAEYDEETNDQQTI